MTFGYSATERGRLWDDGGIVVRNAGGPNPQTRIDDTPLWMYLTTFSTCPGGVGPTNTDEMDQCLSGWTPADGVIFDSTIKDAGRYAFAPRLHDNFSPASWYLIAEIQPIYLQVSYWGCSSGGGPATAGQCDIIHAPGEANTGACAAVPTGTPPGSEPPDTTCGVPGTHNKQLNGVSSFILDRQMLPDDALIPSTGGVIIDLALTR